MEDITALADKLIEQSLGGLGKARIKELYAGIGIVSANLNGMIGNTAADTVVLRFRGLSGPNEVELRAMPIGRKILRVGACVS